MNKHAIPKNIQTRVNFVAKLVCHFGKIPEIKKYLLTNNSLLSLASFLPNK